MALGREGGGVAHVASRGSMLAGQVILAVLAALCLPKGMLIERLICEKKRERDAREK